MQSKTLVLLVKISVIVLTLLSVADLKSVSASPPFSAPKYSVRYVASNADLIPLAARGVIASALDVWTGTPPKDNTFYLVDVSWHTSWAIATLTAADFNGPLKQGQHSPLGLDNLVSLLLVRIDNGWRAAIDVDSNLAVLLAFVPQNELSQSARVAIFPPVNQIRNPNYRGSRSPNATYKFPWPSGNAWRVTYGWHDSYTWGGQFPANTSLDFDIVGGDGANSNIIAAASGTVTYRCTTTVDDQALIYITTDGTSEVLGYLHLSKSSLVPTGTHVNQGDYIGRMASLDNGSGGTTPPAGSCAVQVSMRTHLHIYFPYKPFTIDGYTLSDSSLPWNIDLYSSQGSGSSCSAPSLSFNLQFPGITGYDANNPTKIVTIKLGIPGQSPIQTQQTSASRMSDGSYTGCISLAGLTLNQSYYALVKAPGFLQRKYDAYVLNSTTNLRDWRGIPLRAGDLDENNILNINDVGIILAKYIALSVPVPSGTPADITADNRIDIIDISQVLSNYTALTVPGDDWNYQGQSPSILTNNEKKPATTSKPSPRQSTSLISPLWTNFVNVSMSPSQALYPTIATGTDGTTYVVWTDGRSGVGRLYFAYRPLGYYWSNPELVPNSGNGYSAHAVVDSNGVLHVVYRGGVFPADIYYTSRLINGTWTSPINLSNSQTSGLANVDKPKIAIDDVGNVHAVWQGDSGTIKIYYSFKPSSGGWNVPIVISNNAINSYTPALTTDQNNNVHTVWQSGGVFYSRKSGSSWSSPVQVGTQNVQNPAIVAKSTGELHIVAHDTNGNVMRSSKPLIGSWSEMISILSGATNSQIASDTSDRLHIVVESNGEILEIDEGSDGSFTAPSNLSRNDGQSLTPQIALTNHTVEVVWQDNSSGLEQIYFSDGWPQNGIAPLRFDPESTNISPGDTITTSIYFNSTGIPLSGMVISGTYQYTGAIPDLEPPDKIQINPSLTSNNWGVSVNQIITNSGSVTIELSLINNNQTGYVSPGEILLGTIKFRSTRRRFVKFCVKV